MPRKRAGKTGHHSSENNLVKSAAENDIYIEMEPSETLSPCQQPSTSRKQWNDRENDENSLNDHNEINEAHQHYYTSSKLLVNELPSRNIDVTRKPSSHSHGSNSLHGTLRMRAISVYKDMKEDQVVQMLENDPKVDELDELDAEKHKEVALKELHYSLTGKRKIKAQLDKSTRKKLKRVGCIKQMKYTLSMKWHHFKNGCKESLASLELWHKPLRIIEGNFGSSVASYFYLLRWLLRLNFLTFLIQFLFVVIPQILLNYVPNAQESSLPCNTSSSLLYQRVRPEFSPEILITGGGYLEDTIFYYGGYSNTILNLTENLYYNIPLAYLLVVGFNMIVILIFMAYALAKSYKERFIEHSGIKMNFFSNKVFCGWDFAITNAKAAKLHSSYLCLDLIEHLSRLQKQTVIRNIQEKTVRCIKFLCFNLLALTILGLTGWAIYELLDKKEFLQSKHEFLNDMRLSLTVVLITLQVPTVLTFVVKYEGYNSRRTQLWVTMIRCLLLIGVIVGILLLFWVFTDTQLDDQKCWETEVGKEIYRLVLMDFIVCGVLYFFSFWMKSAIYKCGFTFFGSVEFDVAWNTWNLLYNQVLLWIGALFSPLLSLIVIIKMILTFYIKQGSVRLHSQPAEQTLRAQNAQTIFLVISFLALILSLLGVGAVVTQVEPSRTCGPFRGREYPYNIVFCVTESFREYEMWIGKLAEFITKPGCVLMVIIFLCCIAYYSRAVAAANLNMMKLLRQQVVLEGKDKIFLLRMFDRSHGALFGGACLNTPNRNNELIEASNLNYSQITSGSQRSLIDQQGESARRSEFPRKKSVPAEHRILADYSPGSKRKRQTSVPSESDQDRSSIELYSHRSQESLNSYPYTNQAYREDSPFKSKSPLAVSPFHDPLRPLPGANHQPPFQNLGKTRRSSRIQSDDDLKSIPKYFR